MHEVLVNRLGGLSLPRKSVVRLTDRPDMTLDVYRGSKTTMQQMQQTSEPRTICAKVYSESVQPIKGNNCGPVPTGNSDFYVQSLMPANCEF